MSNFFLQFLCSENFKRVFLETTFPTDFFQIFYFSCKHKYLWSDEAVFNIFNCIINKKNALRHFRAMVILIKKIFASFVSDDADGGYRACHGHDFV